MDTKSIVIGILLSFAMGFYFGSMSDLRPIQKDQSIQDDVWNAKVSQIEKKLKDIEDEDLVEFSLLKKEKDKYMKANEIYGKVFQLFFGQLGLKINVSQWESLNPHLKLVLENFNENYEMNKDGQADFAISPAQDEHALSVWERITKIAKSDSLYKEDGTLVNPHDYFHETELIEKSNALLDILQGNYSSQILLENNIEYTLNINIDYIYNGKNYVGKSSVEIIDNEKKMLINLKEDGDNKFLKSHKLDDDGIVIALSMDNFIHLNYHSVRQSFSGHYYQIDPQTREYKIVGQVTKLSKNH